MKKTSKFIAVICILTTGTTVLTACSSKGSEEILSNTSSQQELKIYLDEQGPYYNDSEGTQHYLSTLDDDTINFEDYMSEPIYDHYEQDGLKFDIPDGWYVDTSYGAPMIISENEEKINEYITIINAEEVFTDISENTKLFDDISKAKLKETFDGYVDEGYYSSYEIKEIPKNEIAGFNTKSFDIIFKTTDENNDEISFYTNYTFVNSEVPQLFVLNADNNEASIKSITDVYNSVTENIDISVTGLSDYQEEESHTAAESSEISLTESANN